MSETSRARKLHTDVWVHDRLEVSDDDELVSWAYLPLREEGQMAPEDVGDRPGVIRAGGNMGPQNIRIVWGCSCGQEIEVAWEITNQRGGVVCECGKSFSWAAKGGVVSFEESSGT